MRHSVEQYGRREVESWYWEVWNEPDIGYWQGTPEEYQQALRLRRGRPEARAADGADRRAARHRPERRAHAADSCATSSSTACAARTTRPARPARRSTSSPSTPRARRASSTATSGWASATSCARSRQRLPDRRVVSRSCKTRRSSSASPIRKAARPARSRPIPQNAYRNGTMYSSYTAAQIARTYELADLHKVNLLGSVTWAFEFEDQPYFDGFRDLATNGIDKPVLNVFRMLGQMGGDRVAVESSERRAARRRSATAASASGPDVNALASAQRPRRRRARLELSRRRSAGARRRRRADGRAARRRASARAGAPLPRRSRSTATPTSFGRRWDRRSSRRRQQYAQLEARRAAAVARIAVERVRARGLATVRLMVHASDAQARVAPAAHLTERTRANTFEGLIRSLRWHIAMLLSAAIAISYLDRQALSVAIAAIQRDIPLSNTRVLAAAGGVPARLCGHVRGRRHARSTRSARGAGLLVDHDRAGRWRRASHGLATGFRIAARRAGFCWAWAKAADFPPRPKRSRNGFRRASVRLAMGMINAGTAVGAVVAPPAIAAILGIASWRWVFFADRRRRACSGRSGGCASTHPAPRHPSLSPEERARSPKSSPSRRRRTANAPGRSCFVSAGLGTGRSRSS